MPDTRLSSLPVWMVLQICCHSSNHHGNFWCFLSSFWWEDMYCTTVASQMANSAQLFCSLKQHQFILPFILLIVPTVSSKKMLLDCQQCHLWPIKSISAAAFFYTTCKHICMSPVIQLSSTCTASSDSKQVSLSTVKRHWRLSTHKEGSMENMEETGASTSRTISNLFTYLRTFMLLCMCFLRHQVPGHLTNLGSFL